MPSFVLHRLSFSRVRIVRLIVGTTCRTSLHTYSTSIHALCPPLCGYMCTNIYINMHIFDEYCLHLSWNGHVLHDDVARYCFLPVQCHKHCTAYVYSLLPLTTVGTISQHSIHTLESLLLPNTDHSLRCARTRGRSSAVWVYTACAVREHLDFPT